MTQYQDEGTTWQSWMKVKVAEFVICSPHAQFWVKMAKWVPELGPTENITDSVGLGYAIASKK